MSQEAPKGVLYVSSGQQEYVLVSNGSPYYQTAVVLGGGTALSAYVGNGGAVYVDDEGLSLFGSVEAGGLLFVSAGGTASGTFVNGYGRLVTDGTAIGVNLEKHAKLEVYADAVASDVTIRAGASVVVHAGGTIFIGELAFGGSETLPDGAFNISGEVVSGKLTVASGGTDSATSVTWYGSGHVGSEVLSGTAIGDVVFGGNGVAKEGGQQFVYGVASDTTIYGGFQIVSSGGRAISTSLEDKWGSQTVLAGGVASDTTVEAGVQVVSSGGSAVSTLVDSEEVLVHGTATDTTVLSGGWQYVSAHGVASGTTIDAGGSATVSAAGSAAGVMVNGGGSVTVLSGGRLGATTIAGAATVTLQSGAVDNASVTFVSSGGTLGWGGTGTLGATVAGFAPGDTLDLAGLAFTSAGKASFVGHVLTVTEGGHAETIHFAAGTGTAGLAWTLTSDGQHGTDVTLVPKLG